MTEATAIPGIPDDTHEWISFEDPDERRVWRFDVTFLTSPWTCIFGAGCQGVLTAPAPELVQGCCSYGAHFVDHDDIASVRAAARRLRRDQWQFYDEGRHANGQVKVAETNDANESVTPQVDDACVFLNRPGFPTGPGCALHQAALEAGERPMDWKPTVCWQLPLRREDEVQADGSVVSSLIQWDRGHWGEGGFEFHWWCTEAPDAFVGREPVWKAMRDEIVEMVGAHIYDRLAAYLASRPAGSYLPHPGVRVQLSARRNR